MHENFSRSSGSLVIVQNMQKIILINNSITLGEVGLGLYDI